MDLDKKIIKDLIKDYKKYEKKLNTPSLKYRCQLRLLDIEFKLSYFKTWICYHLGKILFMIILSALIFSPFIVYILARDSHIHQIEETIEILSASNIDILGTSMIPTAGLKCSNINEFISLCEINNQTFVYQSGDMQYEYFWFYLSNSLIIIYKI